MCTGIKDPYGRTIDYLRISVTDRCNLRCRYCMPRGADLVSHHQILRYEEILMICREALSLGICNFKITGGEPLVRKGVLSFIEALRNLDGVETVTLTTNGVLLEPCLETLKRIGVDAINISLDTADPKEYRQITGSDLWDRVHSSIVKAVDTGIPVKLNCVLLEGGEDRILPLSCYARDYPVDVRFIELMPLGLGRDLGGLSPDTARRRLLTVYPDLHPVEETRGNGPAHYEASTFLKGRIGWIDALSHKFCHSCNRIRLTSAGILKPCLCYDASYDLLRELRSGKPVPEIQETVKKIIRQAILDKPMEHCFEDRGGMTEHRTMSEIGG